MTAINYQVEENGQGAKRGSFMGIRHTQVILLFWLLAIGYGMRVILSVGILAMTDSTINENFPTYDWSIGDRSTMLSSFFWGYVIPQIHAGQLSEKYGPKWFLAGTMAACSFFTVLIPPLASVGTWGVILCRIIQGFTQGFFFPATHYLLTKWIPLSERSRMGSFVYAGGPLGSVITMPVTGWLCASPIGWPSVFYIYGAVGFVWSILWAWLGSNSPSQCKCISEEEFEFIKNSLGDLQTDKKYRTPWLHMLKSLPLWGLLLAYSGQDFGYWMLNTQIPTYMNGVLDFDIENNGLLSAAPYFTLWIVSLIFSALSDFFINRKIFSVNVARKLASGIGLLGPGIALVVLAINDEPERNFAVALLIIAVGINGAIFSGHQVNHMDISPTHSATLMGITNGVANFFSIFAPLMVQFIVTDETNPNQWRIVFFIAAGVYILTDLFYTIVGKADIQYWDRIDDNTPLDITEKPEKEQERGAQIV